MSVENNNLLINFINRATSHEENLTTEAFVHLLRHLKQHEPTIVQDLLKNVFDLLREKKEKNKQEIDLSKPLEVKDLEFKTQAGYTQDETRRQPDISIVAPNYLILVEVKVSAPLGFEQLASYRGVLEEGLKKEKEKGRSKTGILILLSCLPSTKRDSERADVAIFWCQIAKWLEDELNSGITIDATSKYLIEQFIHFLVFVCPELLPCPPPPLPPPGSVHDELRIMLQRNYDELRDLKELDDFPRLHTLLAMMDEIIKATGSQSQPVLTHGSFDGKYIGYDIQNCQYCFYIYYSEKECKLRFMTWSCKIDVKQAKGKFGQVVEDARPLRWQAELNIDGQDEPNTNGSEDSIRIRESYRIREFDRIREFYQRSYEFAQTIIESDPSVT
jgi:hypothetical protein